MIRPLETSILTSLRSLAQGILPAGFRPQRTLRVAVRRAVRCVELETQGFTSRSHHYPDRSRLRLSCAQLQLISLDGSRELSHG
jgi:hypothetical protein